MVQKKDSLIRKMLKRHEEFFDEKTGVSVANDFLQLSKIMEEMRAIEDKRVFHVLYALISENCHLKGVVAERGSRISNLQRSQPRPRQPPLKGIGS